MRRRNLMTDRRGVLGGRLNLVVIALTLATAMGGWIFGLSSMFVRSNRIEIEAVYAIRKGGSFTIFVDVKNVGSSEATIEAAFLNEQPCPSAQFPLIIHVGQSDLVKLMAQEGNGLDSGVTVQIGLQTSDGISYSTMVILP